MRNLLAFLAALLITFGVVGYYLDWFKIESNKPESGHHNVNIDINTQKIGDDIQKGTGKILDKGEEKLQAIEKDKDKPKTDTSKGTDWSKPKSDG
jgi:hypothetical protein